MWGGNLVSDLYYDVMREHQERKCVCTQVGREGDIARAGQFWDGEKDIRKHREAAAEGGE